MAQKLDEFPALSTGRYPWEQWLNGEVWQLFKGQDFICRAETVLSNARSHARGKGGSVRSRKLKEGGTESIIIQFVRR